MATAGAASWCSKAVAPTVPGVVYPRLVEGAGHGPPEDVGGPWGYGEFLEAIAKPKHERHTELFEWCGDFDPQQFNVDEINRRLTSLATRKNTRRKTAKPATGRIGRWPSPDAYNCDFLFHLQANADVRGGMQQTRAAHGMCWRQ